MAVRDMQALLTSVGSSMHSLKGSKGVAPNQDRAVQMSLGGGSVQLLGVLDGHGEEGQSASEICTEVLPKLLLRMLQRARGADPVLARVFAATPDLVDPEQAEVAVAKWHEAVSGVFLETHGLLESMTSCVALGGEGTSPYSCCPRIDARVNGTTATFALVLDSRWLTVAHVGDSRAVFGRRLRSAGHAAEWQVEVLTRDHKGDVPEEAQRIRAAGAQIIEDSEGHGGSRCLRIDTPGQNWPWINMTRSLGDLHNHSQGVTAAAEVRSMAHLWDHQYEEAVIIIASDGVWDVVDEHAAVSIAAQSFESGGTTPAEALALEAYDRWALRGLDADDVTALVKFF